MKTENIKSLLRTYLRENYTPSELAEIADIPTLADVIGEEFCTDYDIIDRCPGPDVLEEVRRILTAMRQAEVIH